MYRDDSRPSDGKFEAIMDELNQQDIHSVQEIDATRDVQAALKPLRQKLLE